LRTEDIKLAVVGLGYVGLPLAVEFGKKRPVIGFDINTRRIAELQRGHDHTLEVDDAELAAAKHLTFTTEISELAKANVYIVTVPTPIDQYKQPDLTPLIKASETIGKVLKRGDIVIYESTVYPGATEEDCVPVLEKTSGLAFNKDFFAGYSPERINPGDKEHRVSTIKKVTSGSTPEVADLVDALYNEIIVAGTHKAPSIRVAEAAKVIENTQRDVNIALINELALIFNKIAVAFDSVFSSADSMSVTAFQNFCKLAPTGAADYQTWCSLLVSNGDPERPGTACDGITEVTAPRAATLWNSGYRYVGRYLTNALNSQLNKKIQPGELSTIFSAGLRVFPIYQTYGGEASYFNATQGRADARDAFNAALAHGFKRGTVIYFAVDYDAQDAEIDANILPHFRAIAAAMAELGSKYRVGVYGSRNVCARVSARGYAKLSFVSGMSTGFSGNLGYLLPSNWAFDQIATKTIGTGTGLINIDNNIASGRDIGQSVVDVDAPVLDVPTPLASIPNYSTFIQDYFWWFEQATTPIQQAVVLHPPQDVFEAILGQHDDLLTSLARGYGMRKSLIETAVLWESSVENILDVGTDAIVRATYAYLEQKEWWDGLSAAEQAVTPAPVPPPVQRRDASTGVSQIFAWVAAEVIDWARALGLTDEPSYDVDDWHQQRDLWMRLNEDDAFNIRMCALVLLWSAADRGIDISQPTFFTDQEIKDTLARYNGTNQDAIAYGERSFGLYSFLESRLNGPARAAAL